MFIHTNAVQPLNLKVIQNASGRLYVTPGGNKYPSITTLLGAGEKPWLTNWRNALGDTLANKETKRASERGDAVHRMIERHLSNDPDPTKGEKIEHVAEFKSVRLYLKKVNNIVFQEAALYSDTLKVAGRVDCIGEYEGIFSIIDFKTSTNDKKDSMIQDYYLQTTAYAVMFQEMYGIQVDNIVIIMTTERGAVPLVFKKSVEDYLGPLCERINTFYTTKKAK